MRTSSATRAALLVALFPLPLAAAGEPPPAPLKLAVSYPASLQKGPLDGRLLLLLSNDPAKEPRFQIQDGPRTQQVFGIDVEGWKPGAPAVFDASVLGYPRESLAQVPKGTFFVQVLLHVYETFHRSDGHTVKLPMDRGEGQQWSAAPGNLYSKPVKLEVDPASPETLRVALDSVIPPIEPPKDTKWVKHESIVSERLTKFWGREMRLGAHVLLPLGWAEHPQARYPLVVNHGHFPEDIDFREEPADPKLPPVRSERFGVEAYNRIEQEASHQLFEDWMSPGFPRVIVVEIQHANPYYDDSYAVNSANLGPYGDAIQYELIPYLEKKYRSIGQGWARFLYGGSTGGWEAMAAQVFYPDEYNGAWIACPDPIDFRAYTVVDVYKDQNAYWMDSFWKRTPRPEERNWLGHVSVTLEEVNREELVLGTRGRSGGQWDIWQAVFGPVGPDGYPKPIWDKRTGLVDHAVAEEWRKLDLMDVLRSRWEKGLGEKLRGKLHIYVGDMDSYYLNDAVYLGEEFLKATKNPPYEGEVAYGDRAEHCWNGDPTRPIWLSRLRYHQLYLPKVVERILKSAPPGADMSWRY